MKNLLCLFGLLAIAHITFAQDEGTIVKRDRIGRDNGLFVGLGPSFTLGKNIGDYSTGVNLEIGYTKRLNRIFSIGPSFSYHNFTYDTKKTGLNNIFAGDEMYDGESGLYYFTALYIDLKGGDLSLYSLSVNLKLNLIPVTDNSKISVYAIAKPFISVAQRTEVKGDGYAFNVVDSNDDGKYSDEEVRLGYEDAYKATWEAHNPIWKSAGIDISGDLKKDSRITGGIFVGPGIEFFPAKRFSFYAQATFGYTFPVSIVSTKKYEGNRLENLDERYPIIEAGFPSINLQFGASFNF
jgi:hypothetical protein